MKDQAPCRCGHSGDGPHPCHRHSYTCRKPAAMRVYNPHLAGLGGQQLKFGAEVTWACDECWEAFCELLKEAS